MWKNIRYFSVAVTNLEAGVKLYEDMFGLRRMTETRETRWGFRAAMLGDGENAMLEIVQPSRPDSALARFMKERSRPQNPDGEGVYIISVDVENLEETMAEARRQGGKVNQDPELPEMAWVHPLNTKYAFIELHGPPKH